MTFDRVPVAVSVRESIDLCANPGRFLLHAQWLRPTTPKRTAVVMMHPTGILQNMALPTALAGSGVHVVCAASRHIKNDATLQMEHVVVDLGAVIEFVRSELGFERVVLLGWSGGASLTAFYQSQARTADVHETPAGRRYDLAAATLPLADAVVHVAGHVSRARILSEWIDPSVQDESDPSVRDPQFHLYGAEAPRPPFAPEFVATYRSRQAQRIARITAAVRARLEKDATDRPFLVFGTMADPRWTDLRLDPNERSLGCGLGDGATLNDAPGAMARVTSLHSWLSQWSPQSNADGVRHVARLRVPYLMVENAADDACPRSHVLALFEAATTNDKEHVVVDGANHFYGGSPKALADAVAYLSAWLGKRDLL